MLCRTNESNYHPSHLTSRYHCFHIDSFFMHHQWAPQLAHTFSTFYTSAKRNPTKHNYKLWHTKCAWRSQQTKPATPHSDQRIARNRSNLIISISTILGIVANSMVLCEKFDANNERHAKVLNRHNSSVYLCFAMFTAINESTYFCVCILSAANFDVRSIRMLDHQKSLSNT